MFRRSRFSVRPNVGVAGRTAAAPQEAPSANQEAGETPKDVAEGSSAAAVTDNKPVVTPSEKPSGSGDGSEQNGEGTSSSAAVQRRKRFAIKPKVAPGRLSSLARKPKSPVKAASESPAEVRASDLDRPSTSGQTTTAAGLQSPRRRRPSEESKQLKVQPKPTLTPADISGPSAVPPAEEPQERTHLPADNSKQSESASGGQVKDVPSRIPDKVPHSLPDKEAIEISEKAKTLVSSKDGLSKSQPAFCLSRLLNDPSDMQRLEKARKLRELLRQEIHKEKKIKRAKARAKEFTLDPAKMTMRDLIRYLPVSNPMTSSLEDPAAENETVVPPSPEREESPERAQEPEPPPVIASPRVEEEEEAAEEEQEEALMVPQVKVAEDGSLIIDEESLTVEVQRAKGPNLIQDRDPIFERGSTTTYSSFRKGTHSKPWSSEETDMFFLAVSMVGTDFSMICQLFPHRARSEIKNKFKKEERENSWRIDKAFRERRKLDIEYFSKLLEKILEVQKNRKKLKSLSEKNSPKKHKRKAKGRKAAKKLSDVEEEDEEEESEMPDLEGEEEEKEGEKENEDLCNEGGAAVSKPKKKCKRKNNQDTSTEEPSNKKKNKTGGKSSEQDEASIPEDTEAALPEDQTNSDMSEKTKSATAAKNAAIKPAKLSRGRAPKPLLPLGRKWGKKPPLPSTKATDAVSDKGDEGGGDGASKEQVEKDASPTREADKKSANDEVSSEEEEVAVKPPRPTRYGRVPKPTKPLTYPAKDDAQSSASETAPASPAEAAASSPSAAKSKPKNTAKRGRSSKAQSTQESKKPKLVMLKASQSEYSDEENEKQCEGVEEMEEVEEYACSFSKDSTAPAFVPASLRSPHPVIPEVEETMEELDILANMPDVLGISKDALCPDSSFELAQNETITAEPCEHQLDLLVDVIDFLSSEHTEVSEDQSYNEAAQTLLTIGNLAHLCQSAQSDTSQVTIQDHTTVETSFSVDVTSHHLEVEIAPTPAAQEINRATIMSAASAQEVTEEVTPETADAVEQQNSSTDKSNLPIIETSDHRVHADMDPTPQSQSSPQRTKTNSPQTKRGRLSKVKPKPNLGHPSRSAQSRSQPETKTDTAAPDLSQTTERAAKAESTQKLTNDEISSTEVKLAEEPSDSQERCVGQVKPGAAELDQSVSDNQSHFSGTQFEPSLELKTRESSSDNLVTAVTEPQIGHETNTDSVQQSSDHPAPSATPETPEETPLSPKEASKDASTCQTRSSQIQEVQPKPNQTSKTEVSEPQTVKETDSNPMTNPKLNEKPMMDVEAQPAWVTSSEKPSQSTCPLSELLPSSDSGSSHMEEVTTAKENETDVGDVAQVDSGAATSDQEKLMFTTTERTCSDPLPSDSADPESQVGQGSNINHPAPCETPAEDSPASQKEDNKAQTRRSQYQRVRPKPNVAQASRSARSKPQITKDTVEKDSNQTPNPKLHETTVMDVEAQPTCTASSEKTGQSTDQASDVLPSVDLGSSLKPTEEPSTSEEKKIDVGLVSPVESENQNTRPTSESTEETLVSQVESADSSSVNLLTSDSAISESQVQQRLNMDPLPVRESSNHPASSVTPAEDSRTSQTEKSEVTPAVQTRKSRFQRVKPKPNLAQASRSAHSKPQIIKDSLEKASNAAADPKLSGSTPSPTEELSTAEEERMDVGVVVESGAATSDQSASENQDTSTTSRPESTDSGKPEVKAVPTCSHTSGKPHEPTGDLSSTESQDTTVGSALELCSQDSEKNEPQRRRRFSKVKPKPNLRSSTRTTQTKLQSVSKPSDVHHVETSSDVTSQQKPEDNKDAQTQLKPAEKDGEHLIKTVVEGTSSYDAFSATSSDTEHLSGSTDSGLGKNSEKSSAEGESTDKKIGTETASQGDCKQDESAEATETKPADDSPAISDVKSSEDCSAKSKTPDSEESTQKPHSEKDSEAPTQDSAQNSSETTLTTQTAAQSDDKGLESSNSSKSSRKAPQTRRGRLVKPKPNLGPRNQPPKSQQVQNVKQAAADSEGVVPSVSHKPESEVQPDTQKPAGGAIDQHRNQTKDPDDAAASLGCLTQVTEPVTEPVTPHDSSLHAAGLSLGFETNSSTLDASASSTGGTQSQPSLTIFPDILLDQVPSDPDEPFFILSLTEIPVSSSGEMMDGASEPLPYLPVADASVQQESSVSGDGSLSNVAVPASMEEGGETGLIDVNTGSFMENPVDPHEITGVQPSVLLETTGNNDETEHPPSKRGPGSSGRTAKLQVKPQIPRRKQASRTLTDKEAESVSTQESELPDSSVQPKAFDEVVNEPQTGSGDDVNVVEREDKSSGAPATRTRRADIQKKKPRDFPSFLSEMSSAAQSAHKGPEVETPHTAGRRSTTSSPKASTSHDVAVATGPMQPPSQAEVDLECTPDHSRVHSEQILSTSSSAAEVTAPEHIDIVESSSLEEEDEEEPTNVSQYFLSDIFTDVEEG